MTKTNSLMVRYGISTLGLLVVALGVGLSIKSNLGIAPLSCIPTVLSLRFTHVSVGTFTWIFNLLFIVLQAAILRKDFKWEHVLQVLPILIFGYMVDGAIWLFDALKSPATNYVVQILLCLGAVVLTAVGIRLEVVGQGWILPADNTLYIITLRTDGRGAGSHYGAAGPVVLRPSHRQRPHHGGPGRHLDSGPPYRRLHACDGSPAEPMAGAGGSPGPEISPPG